MLDLDWSHVGGSRLVSEYQWWLLVCLRAEDKLHRRLRWE